MIRDMPLHNKGDTVRKIYGIGQLSITTQGAIFMRAPNLWRKDLKRREALELDPLAIKAKTRF